ncbi:MAG: hypothetical protein WBB08_06505 [Halobacteriota archaeon]
MPEIEEEWEEVYKMCDEKVKELKPAIFQLIKVGQKRIDRSRKKIEDIPHETPKMKTRDKAKKTENVLYDLPENVENLSELVARLDKGLKDVEERTQVYKSSKEEEKKKR